MNELTATLQRIEQYVLINTKNVLNLTEAAILTGLKPDTIRKMAQRHDIAFYKPNRNMLYFLKQDLEKWMMQNRESTQQEIDQKAAAVSYRTSKRRKPCSQS